MRARYRAPALARHATLSVRCSRNSRVLSRVSPSRGHPTAQSPRGGDPGVLGAKSTCHASGACAAGRGGPSRATRSKSRRFPFASRVPCAAIPSEPAGLVRRGDRVCKADAEIRKFGGAIPPRVFRPCVRLRAERCGAIAPKPWQSSNHGEGGFELSRISPDVLCRLIPVASNQRLHARAATDHERRRISRAQHRRP